MTPTPSLRAPEIAAVVDHWRATLHPRAKRTVIRCDLVLARLNEGYSVDELKAAVDGCARSDWHRRRGHTDLALICRDAIHVDRFIAQTQRTASGLTPERDEAARKRMEAIRKQLEEQSP